MTIGLAPRRPSRIPLCAGRVERDLGVPSVSLNRLIACRPPAGRVETTRKQSSDAGGSDIRRRIRGRGLRRWRLGFKQSGFRHITRDSRGNAFDAFTAFHASPPCYFPLPLSRSGRVGVPEVTSSQTSAPCRGDPAPSETAHFLSPFGVPPFASWPSYPATGFSPPRGRLTESRSALPDRSEFSAFRTCEIRPVSGVLSSPGPWRSRGQAYTPGRHRRFTTTGPRRQHHIPPLTLSITRFPSRLHLIHPSGLPLACCPWMVHRLLGVPLGFTPRVWSAHTAHARGGNGL